MLNFFLVIKKNKKINEAKLIDKSGKKGPLIKSKGSKHIRMFVDLIIILFFLFSTFIEVITFKT